MEKFGIFELLDALSAITAPSGDLTAPQSGPSDPPPEKPAGPKKPDEAFQPPVYGTVPPASPPPRESDALADFLARHDAVAKKAKK